MSGDMTPIALDWSSMDAATRRPASSLTRELVPDEPGVYAWYRESARMYVGEGGSLRSRIWTNHLGQNKTLKGSALRRNVAQYLKYGSAAAINAGTIVLTTDQLAAVRAWILSCEVAWLTCATKDDALALEKKLRTAPKLPLNKL
jgi:hypothetical protein